MRDGLKERAVEVSNRGALLQDVYEVSENEVRREAVLKVCENKKARAGGADSLAEEGGGGMKVLFCATDKVSE